MNPYQQFPQVPDQAPTYIYPQVTPQPAPPQTPIYWVYPGAPQAPTYWAPPAPQQVPISYAPLQPYPTVPQPSQGYYPIQPIFKMLSLTPEEYQKLFDQLKDYQLQQLFDRLELGQRQKLYNDLSETHRHFLTLRTNGDSLQQFQKHITDEQRSQWAYKLSDEQMRKLIDGWNRTNNKDAAQSALDQRPPSQGEGQSD
ncbi:hypothetical protein O1611_g1531 [Lasiodiplodia mahajangana]|uniref:Uncharacterized protein n=1 Tax=Lasiodiplodia mahajangana TaxID=1108764 RepID=A0ACC2JX93_9PEZI|nr:hypothetical protein O1611_g1531 [Lasiodiplodia mahajangana]